MTINSDGITPEQVRLPERFQEQTVRNLFPGEHTYISTWDISIDHDGMIWLSLDATPVPKDELGEVWLARVEEGFIVELLDEDHQWKRTYVAKDDPDKKPIIGIIENEEQHDLVQKELSRLAEQLPAEPA